VGIESQANPPAPGIKVQYPAKITSVDAVDKYTVRINMSGPDPSIIGYFALNTVMGFNFLGDGLRDVLDPRLRNV
jgi:ABC-type transport system substrate-binding protein